MLWIKAFHIIAMVAWFAGLFYLPRLFVYHAGAIDNISLERFKIMEKRLYYFISYPAALLTSALGLLLLSYNWSYYLHAAWLHAKFSLVLLLWGYHLCLGHYLRLFAMDKNKKDAKFYRVINEIPTLFLVAIVILVVVKPM